MPRDTADRLEIRALIENWALWRDARLWDRFRTVWHKEGQMWATWFQGSSEDFIKVSQEGYDRGVRIMHMLGGYDFLEKRKGKWGLVLRRLAYEKDRLDPVEPGTWPKLDKTLLAQFPEGYRHLAYLQTRIGYKVKPDMPGLDGPELDALYAKGEAWLKGKKL